jgi:hypothetical protein
MQRKTVIFGHTVSYDDVIVAGGIYFLARQINVQEAKIFFDEAYDHGSAVFQDHRGYKFKLVHHGGEYQLVKA